MVIIWSPWNINGSLMGKYLLPPSPFLSSELVVGHPLYIWQNFWIWSNSEKIWVLPHLYARARYGYIWAQNSPYIPLLTPKKRQKTNQVVQKKGQKIAHNFSKGQKNLWAKYE